MSALKNLYNRNIPTRNLISTITGAVVLVISGFSLFGILTAEQAASLTQYATAIVTAVAGIIGLFYVVDPA